jgi:hypothetical protein
VIVIIVYHRHKPRYVDLKLSQANKGFKSVSSYVVNIVFP